MRIFLTGATGFIGSRIVPELLEAGHEVLGLTRSDSGARALEEAGARVHRGTLEDLASLRTGAEQADAIIHTAFDHDFPISWPIARRIVRRSPPWARC
jgi:nucleoside-diphosphate-sugar epimerase